MLITDLRDRLSKMPHIIGVLIKVGDTTYKIDDLILDRENLKLTITTKENKDNGK